MKLHFLKFIYLINDLTSMALGKERHSLEKENVRLKIALLIFGLITIIIVGFNIYFWIAIV